MADIMILGSGGFGISLAVMAHHAGHSVTLWTPFEEEAGSLNRLRENPKLLKDVKLPEEIVVTTSQQAAASADLVIFAVPSFAVRSTARRFAGVIPSKTVVANVGKGLEETSLKRLSQVLAEELDNPIVALSGPSHAEEIARGVPTTIVAACAGRSSAEQVQDLLMNSTLRIYTNDDVVGVELGGALKNVIALCAGIADGLQLGDNSKAALMTRGITEIARLGVAMGAKTETFAGLSGIGDLIVTCTSMHSRNRRAGILIGQGIPAPQAVEQIGMTVEGYLCAKSAHELAQKARVDMPIIEQAYQVLYEGKSPQDGIRDLMERPKRHESEVIWLLSKS